MTQHAMQAYHKRSVSALTPGQQVAMLLEKAARSLELAKSCIEQNDIEGRYNHSELAMTIVSGLRGSLDRSVPESANIINTLENYYDTVIYLIGNINVKNSTEDCDTAVASLKEMATNWREVERVAEQEKKTTENVAEDFSAVPVEPAAQPLAASLSL